jgi:hypothetical protein
MMVPLPFVSFLDCRHSLRAEGWLLMLGVRKGNLPVFEMTQIDLTSLAVIDDSVLFFDWRLVFT